MTTANEPMEKHWVTAKEPIYSISPRHYLIFMMFHPTYHWIHPLLQYFSFPGQKISTKVAVSLLMVYGK